MQQIPEEDKSYTLITNFPTQLRTHKRLSAINHLTERTEPIALHEKLHI